MGTELSFSPSMVQLNTMLAQMPMTKCVTVRGMLPNADRNVLFSATFEDDSQAVEFSNLMQSNIKLAFMMVQMESKSLTCVALPAPTLGLESIPEDRESVC